MPLPHPRQDVSHPHGVTLSADGRYLYVPDLGRNSVYSYSVDYAAGTLALIAECTLSRAGAGPRHVALGNDRAYAVCELDNTVVAFTVDPGTGTLTESSWASTLPDGYDDPPPFDFYDAPSHAAGILFDAEAGRVYATNRGHDSIAVLSVDGDELKLVGNVHTEGRLPWTIERVPGTNLLLTSNQFNAGLADPGNVALFAVSGDSEMPTFVGTRGFVTLPKVMCAHAAPLE